MKIAVTYEDGKVFQHFGHTEAFKLYDVEGGKVIAARVLQTNGSGHGALARFLKSEGADALICGGIGGGAQMALADAGIRLYAGVEGDADAAVEALLRGELHYANDATCSHHEHAHGEGCGHGEHSCAEHGAHGEHGCTEHGGCKH